MDRKYCFHPVLQIEKHYTIPLITRRSFVKRSLLLFFLPFIVFTYFTFIAFQKTCDYAMNVQAEKKIPFNHKSHITQYGASDCGMCHKYYENGRFKGIPTAGDCKVCHDGNNASNKPILKNFKDNEKPWESFAQQPALVYFSHTAVLKNNKNARCASCHGDKAGSTTSAKIKGKMLMGECTDCHNSLKISNACTVCHD